MASTTISITIDNSILPTAIAALNWKHGYQTSLDNGTINTVTPAQDAKAAVRDYVKNAVIDYQNQQAIAAVQPPADGLIS